jgi:hypothetical protein
MWKFSTVVTSLPLANTVSRNVPDEWTTIGNGQVSELAGIVRVRSKGVIVTVGPAAVAAGTSTATTAAAPASTVQMRIAFSSRWRSCQDH